MYRRRVLACLAGGSISALICVTGGHIRGMIVDFSHGLLAASILNRLLIGCVIAISQWRIGRLLHGAAIGLLVSLTTSLAFLPQDRLTFVLYTSAGIAYGMLTELLATVVFKAPMRFGAERPLYETRAR
ncbi:MAG: hypothetical protein JXO72_05070 [Vicinamibacteria bacterium]|nr:hypothetical protein [Vicinamibacteria bacterium]